MFSAQLKGHPSNTTTLLTLLFIFSIQAESPIAILARHTIPASLFADILRATSSVYLPVLLAPEHDTIEIIFGSI